MEASTATTKATCHARSNSLPSRSHPLIVDVEDQLSRLRASSGATSSSPSIISQNLAGLKDLYGCLDNLLQFSFTQQAFSHKQNNKCVEDVLDRSLRLLDMCSTTRDVFSQMKCSVQDLESSLRKRNGVEASLANEIEKYMISRKKVNRIVHKCFGNMKSMQKCNVAVLDHDLAAMVGMLREVEAVSLTVFEFLLSIVCPQKASSKSTGWSFVSKLIQSKRVSCEGEDDIDAALSALRHKSSKGIDVKQVQNALKNLKSFESTLQELEEGLECVFRCLIKTRVSLLNVLNH